ARAACEAIDRDPATLRRSAAVTICCGSDGGEVTRRAQAIGREVEELKANGACGTVAEVVDRLGQWRDAGAEAAYLQLLDLTDLDHLRLLATEVLPALA
ncbi:MAG: LLM class F420-dependent oxidoreductase, partial [Acidimicrobiales bacterium]